MIHPPSLPKSRETEGGVDTLGVNIPDLRWRHTDFFRLRRSFEGVLPSEIGVLPLKIAKISRLRRAVQGKIALQ